MDPPSRASALTRRNMDNLLMPPPPPPKRQKRPAQVLDEDVYSDALSHIIARDFFPGLLETEAQSEYLQALDSKNNDWIREAGRKLTQVMTPGPETRRRGGRGTSLTPRRSTGTAMGETPRGYAGETPARTPKTEVGEDHFAPEEEPQQPEVDVNMSLGAFQAKYTSEDNESFNTVLDKQNERRAAKYGFFHNGNKILAPRQIAHRERQQKLLENGGTSSTSTALITTNAAGQEVRALASGNQPSQDLDARPASLDSFPNREGSRNHFMFDPEGIEDAALAHAQAAEVRSNAPPKSVTYAATRFRPAMSEEAAVPSSPSMSTIDAAIAGRPKPTESEDGYSGAETPRVNGYAFVDAEPTPSEVGVPVTEEEADAAEREAATALLPKVEEGGPNPFTIHERSEREELHRRLVEKADAGRRKGGGGRMEQLRNLGITPGRTPTPKFSSAPGAKGKGAMTPAARMLAASLQTPKRRSEGFAAQAEKKAWTPTPRVKRAA